MLRIRTAFLTVSIALSVLWLFSFAHATRSRLMGMGDLSIVIEDESNMLNLWDFARNPAGFLEDERMSVIRAEVGGETDEVNDIACSRQVGSYYKCRQMDEILRSSVLGTVRRMDNFALGFESHYFLRKSTLEGEESELEYPGAFLVFSKRLNSATSVGAEMGYVEYTADSEYKQAGLEEHSTTRYVRAAIGAERRVASYILVAGLLRHQSIDSEDWRYLSDSHTLSTSLQTIIDIEHRLKLGLETSFNLRRADFVRSISGDESYFFTYVTLRGIYEVTSRLTLGTSFVHNDLSSGYSYPIDVLMRPISGYASTTENLGIGLAYKFGESVLTAVEFHFRNSSEPDGDYPKHGFRYFSVRVGLEGELSTAFALRIGYAGVGTGPNPPGQGQHNTAENALTLGIGYQPRGAGIVADLSYRYARRELAHWQVDWETKTETNALLASFKITM